MSTYLIKIGGENDETINRLDEIYQVGVTKLHNI